LPSEKQGDEYPDPESDANRLIRMFAHGIVGSLRAFDRSIADSARHFPGGVQRGGETFASFPDFFSGNVSGGGQQGARIFSERAEVVTGCLCIFVHIFMCFLFVFVSLL